MNSLKGIGIVALGGYDADAARLPRAIARFEERGLQVRVAPVPDATARHQRFSASEAVRLDALQRMVVDPDVDVVMALRGGYGITRLLGLIDFDAAATAIRERGKRFVGHSDFTAFQLALLARTGAISFAGPMASYDFGGEQLSAFTQRHFWTLMEQAGSAAQADVQFGMHLVTQFMTDSADCAAQGTLWGGNLAMLCSLIGTPWMPRIANGILFLEDVNEHPYRIERMLLQLQQCGVLAGQRAILLGDFSGYKLNGYDNGYDLNVALDWVRSQLRVPVVKGLPFGHCADKLTLPVGGRAEVAVTAGVCHLALSC